jgi:hypothetical protein
VGFEDLAGDDGDAADVVPGDAGARVEIDAELVGVVEVGGEDRVRVELHAAEVDDPKEAGGVVDDDLFGGAAGGEAKRDGAEVGWEIGGGALLVEGLGFCAVDEALEDDGAVLNALQGSGRYGEEVTGDVELGELDLLGEVELGGAGDADVMPVYSENLGFGGLGHGM